MDVAQAGSAKDRIAAAIGSSGVTRTGAVSAHRERPLPTAAALLWTPSGKPGPHPVSPIFIMQSALEAVHARVAALPDGASSLGFLVGAVCRSPETRVPYIIVESTIHIPWAITGDHLASALRQGRAIAQGEVERTGYQLLGWYHSMVGGPARLSVTDVDAHVACFEQVWNVAMVVARDTELTGGMFRIGSDALRSTDYLPFYVLPGDDPPAAAWANYWSHRVSLSSDAESLPAVFESPPPLLFPEAEGEVDGLVAPASWRSLAAPAARVARVAAVGLVTAGALFGGYRALVSGPPGGSAGTALGEALPVTAATTLARLDRLADTVAFAVTGFDIRARLFASRKMSCTDLTRGLIELEQRWIAHTAARRTLASTPDSARAARDQQLNADVGAVERRFARTGCPRP